VIADLKPYPEYKESGLPWLGRMPGHWEVKRAKSIFQRIDERSKTGQEELLTVSSARGIVSRKTANVTMFKAESYLGYKLCWPGDLVINSLWAWAGGLGVSSHHGIISSAYGVYRIRPNAPMTPAFVHEVVRSSSFNWELRVRSKGVWISRLQLTDVSFLDAPMHIPPPAEQAAIVRFLDWANGRLERAIRAKRKQLALVRERVLVETEQALRREGVVRKRLSTIAQVMSRRIDRRGDQIYTRIGLYNRGRGIFHKPAVPGTDLGDSEFFSVCPGDCVISGQFAWEGAVALARAKESGCIASHRYPIFRGYDGIASSAFLFSFFRSSYGAMLLDHHSRGAAGRNRPLNAQRLLKEEVPVPSRSTQERIGCLLEQEYAVAQSVERMVGVINEYRTRLVADVVIGKLDVREAAARLPGEPPLGSGEDDTDLGDDAEAAEEEVVV